MSCPSSLSRTELLLPSNNLSLLSNCVDPNCQLKVYEHPTSQPADFPVQKGAIFSTPLEGHHAVITLSFNGVQFHDNFLLDTGCAPDLFITQELADILQLKPTKKGTVSGANDVKSSVFFTTKPIHISFSCGRETIRETNSNKAFIGGSINILGRDAMRRLRIGIPETPGMILLYQVDEEDEVL